MSGAGSPGEPLETVLGWVAFLDRRLVVAPGVFVPRRRTELLARTTLAHAAARRVVVEMCCGVAPVAAVLEGMGAEVHAADVSEPALACAALNAPGARLHHGDLFDALPGELTGRIDVLVANAPYVPSARIASMPAEARDHEPHVALDGGVDGVDLHRRLAGEAPGWLAPGGVLLIETGRDQLTLTLGAMHLGRSGDQPRDRRRGRRLCRGRPQACRSSGCSSGGAGVTMPTSASACSISSREMPSR